MIYLDNAATTWPKPPTVRAAVRQAMERYGANPGRGGYAMSTDTAGEVYRCRETAAEFFGLSDPSRVIFTANCTAALNIVIKGLLKGGGHVVISNMEHNAVVRPLTGLSSNGVTYSIATVAQTTEKTLENVRRCLRADTKLIVCTHASNVFGSVLPIAAIGRLAQEKCIAFVVDAAQSAGILPIDMERDNVDFLCVPGHKGLYGPMGTGMLLCRSSRPLEPLVEGGTGSYSLSFKQPLELPDRLESGTLNVPGICGLRAGLEFVKREGRETLLQRERWVMMRLYDRLCDLPSAQLYTKHPNVSDAVPLIAFNLRGRSSEDVATQLAKADIAVRAGLHCAPLAHQSHGTLPNGTVRVAPSAFTRTTDVDELYKNLIKISRKPCNTSIVW